MDFDSFLSAAAGILGLAGIAGGAVAVLTAARRREMDRIAKDDRQSLANRVQSLETENATLREQASTQAAQIAMLTEMVTNAAAVAKLAEMLNGQHSVVVDRLDRMIAAIPKRGDDARP